MKKIGEFRVLKGTAVYGPMTRVDLDRLLAAERVKGTDKVSFRNGDWQPIADFIEAERTAAEARAAQVSESASDPAESNPAPVSPGGKSTGARDGNLRVLKGNRIFSSLTRQQILDLLSAGRITGDDLVCALDGPWMLLADFVAPPPAVGPPPVALEDELDPYEEAVENVAVHGEQDEDELEVIDDEAQPLQMSDVADAAAVRQLLDEPQELSDHWYARVRGIHSAPLQKRHLHALVQAKELTPECVARHGSWGPNHWQSIRSVPQLESILR